MNEPLKEENLQIMKGLHLNINIPQITVLQKTFVRPTPVARVFVPEKLLPHSVMLTQTFRMWLSICTARRASEVDIIAPPSKGFVTIHFYSSDKFLLHTN